jgi:putative nucleotidyltransferase with HDIG domain
MNMPLRLLLVEDSEDDSLLLTREIRKGGYELSYIRVETPDEYQAALDGGPWDIILSDYSLPGWNGLEALRILKQKSMDLPFILVSGKIGEETAVEAMKSGAHDYVMKDHQARLLPAIKRELAEAEERRKRRQAEQELGRTLEKLRKTQEGMIEALIITMEKRDPYTAGHQLRVARLSQAIANELKFTEDRIQAIYTAGMLHDLGKISVSTEILTKPGRISAEEFDIIKTHALSGYEILKSVEFPWPIAGMVLQHHERLDGSGYPAGLHGEEIQMEARILAVADVVEAMTYNRPYRQALGLDAALEEIRNNRGLMFDEDVVDAFLGLRFCNPVLFPFFL